MGKWKKKRKTKYAKCVLLNFWVYVILKMADFFGMATGDMDIKDPMPGLINAILNPAVGLTDYIEALEKKDIDNIFNNTKKTPAGHIEFFTGEEWLELNKDQKQRTYAASTKIIAAYGKCDIKDVEIYFNEFDRAHQAYIRYNGPDALDELIIKVGTMSMAGGGRKKQTGGGIVEIAGVLAGLDVIILRLLSDTKYDPNKQIPTLVQVFENAASLIAKIPDCIKFLLGDTYYRLVERLATSIIGYKFVAFTWEYKITLLNRLLALVSYAPDVARGTMALTIGFVATKVIVRIGYEISAVDYNGKLKTALDGLDAATVEQLAKVGINTVSNTGDLTKKFFDLSVELVIKIRKQLADAHEKTVLENAIAKAEKISDMQADWEALLNRTKLKDLTGQIAFNAKEKERLNHMFTEQFATIQNAIRMSPEYIAAAALATARTEAEIAEAKIAEETMARDLEAAMARDKEQAIQRQPERSRAADGAMGPDANAMDDSELEETVTGDGVGQGSAMGAVAGLGEKENEGAGEEPGAKRTRLGDGLDNLGGGKRKSQKQQRQKQQKKTQKQSHKKLSKSKRAKKAKQSKKANKKH